MGDSWIFFPRTLVPCLIFFILTIVFFIPKIITCNFITYLYFLFYQNSLFFEDNFMHVLYSCPSC